MSSSVEMKWRSAPSFAISLRSSASLSARDFTACGAVFVHRVRGQARAVVPDVVQQVEVGAQRDAARGQRRFQQARHGQAQHAPSTATVWPGCRRSVSQSMCCRLRPRGSSSGDAAARPVRLGLRPVAAVGPQAGEIRVTTSVPTEP
jgi:hypothetical protein